MGEMAGVVGALIPIVGIIWLGFIIWAAQRRKEREAFYRSELLKKIVDSPGGSAQGVLDMILHEEREAETRRREGLKLGGLIVIAGGIGLTALLAMLERDEPAWVVGLMPILIGIVLFGYVRFLAPRADQKP